MLELYRNDYATMQEHMIYEEAPAFDDVIEKLKMLRGRFRLKKDSRSLGEILDRARTQATSLEGEAVSVIVVYVNNPDLPEEPNNITARYRVDFIRKNQNLLFENITSLPR
jgi:hypothetical protein